MHHMKARASRNRQIVKDVAARIGADAAIALFVAETGFARETIRHHIHALFGTMLERRALAAGCELQDLHRKPTRPINIDRLSAAARRNHATGSRNREAVHEAASRLGPGATSEAVAAASGVSAATARRHLRALFGPADSMGRRIADIEELARSRGQIKPATAAEARRNIAAAKARKDACYFPPVKPHRPPPPVAERAKREYFRAWRRITSQPQV